MLGKTVCIGVGAMGGALLRGALSQGILRRDDVVRRPEHRDELVDELGVTGFVELPDMAQFDTIILAVKPQVLPSVLSPINVCESGCYGYFRGSWRNIRYLAQSITNRGVVPCHAEYSSIYWMWYDCVDCG